MNAAPKAELKPVGKLDADQLLTDADKALAFTVKAARADGKELDASNPDAKPFLESLKKIKIAIDQAKKALAAKDESFFTAINDANTGVYEMQVTFDLTKSKNPDVIEGAKKLGSSIIALQENYNPLKEREAKAGDLTADEAARFEKMKGQMQDLLKQLKGLSTEDKADPVLEAGLKKIHADAHRIEKAPNTVKAYADAVNTISVLAGLIGGYEYFVAPDKRTEWTGVETDETSIETDYSYTDYSYDWSSTTEDVEVYDDESVDITDEEVTSEDSYVEDTSFDMTEAEDTEVADEGDEMSESDDDSEELDSDQEDEDTDMDDSDSDDSGGDDSDDSD